MSNKWSDFDMRWGLKPLPDAGKPVFILSSGWRTGSTLLQRIVCSSREVLVWGEPYGMLSLIPQLTQSACGLPEGWPRPEAIAPERLPDNLEDHWIANFYPEPEAIRAGFRAQLDSFLAEPARRRGFSRFGIKEVRLSALDAMFLQWIYPDAIFFFIVRNPWDAWSSAKGYADLPAWCLRWPNDWVRDAAAFARHWKVVVETHLAWSDESCMIIRFEDLIRSDFDFGQMARHASIRVNAPTVLSKRIRGPIPDPVPLDQEEISVISKICSPFAKQFDYHGPTGHGEFKDRR